MAAEKEAVNKRLVLQMRLDVDDELRNVLAVLKDRKNFPMLVGVNTLQAFAVSSISKNWAGLSVPLSNPVGVIAIRRGLSLTTALRFPLVPNIHPRWWKLLPTSASAAAKVRKEV